MDIAKILRLSKTCGNLLTVSLQLISPIKWTSAYSHGIGAHSNFETGKLGLFHFWILSFRYPIAPFTIANAKIIL
jgi:hypothetical protein